MSVTGEQPVQQGGQGQEQKSGNRGLIPGCWFVPQETAWDRLHRATAAVQQPRWEAGERERD